MSFVTCTLPETIQSPMGDWSVAVLGSNGIRLSKGTHFHLDEGPEFAWLSIYRAAADARQIDIVRQRQAEVSVEEGDAVVRWPPCPENNGRLSVRYRVFADQLAVEMGIRVEVLQPYAAYELFVSSYFTPYHRPRFALRDASVDAAVPMRWYETAWCGEFNDEAWPRDGEARRVFLDGRWMTKPSQNWMLGPDYALPLMTQQHRFGPSVVSMARRRDCIGLSGYNGFHNSQYFHLFGGDAGPGDLLETTVRLEVVEGRQESLDDLAVARYEAWSDGG